MTRAARTYVEVNADTVPRSLRRLAAQALSRSPAGSGIRLRWCRPVKDDDPRAKGGFVAGDVFYGRVFTTKPDEVWLNADMAAGQVVETVVHEVEHARILRVSGPPRSYLQRDIHEFAADLAAELARPGAVSLELHGSAGEAREVAAELVKKRRRKP